MSSSESKWVVHVKQSTDSCCGQKKLHRVIYSSSWKILIIVDNAYKGFSYIICLTIVTSILIATSVPPMFGPGKLYRATLIMSEVCDTPITNNHGGTNSPTRNRHYILPDEDLQCGRSVAINIRVIIARPNPHSGRGFQHLNLSLVCFDPIRLMRSKPQDAYLYKTTVSPRVPRFQTSKQGRI